MHHKGLRFIANTTAALIVAVSTVWAQSKTDKPQASDDLKAIRPLVTFVELGSVKCVPC